MNLATTCEDYQELLSGYLDGELTQGDRQRVEVHVASCAACRKTFEQMSQLRDEVGRLEFGEMGPGEWSAALNGAGVKTSRWLGWVLYVGGAVLLVGYGIYEFIVDGKAPSIIKVGVVGLYLGLGLLFVSVLRQRMIASKSDNYKDVQI